VFFSDLRYCEEAQNCPVPGEIVTDALGQKRTFNPDWPNVRFAPKADIGWSAPPLS
jgi:hypothetical protein